MKSKKELLELRKKMALKRPVFLRQEARKRKRLGKKWRSPTGIHSKRRNKKKGKGPVVSVGYKGPKEVRGLVQDCKKEVIVSSLSDLLKLDRDGVVVSIKSSVGKKKRLDMIKIAEKNGIKILNIPDTKKYTEEIANDLSERKSRRSKIKGIKEKKGESKKEEDIAEELKKAKKATEKEAEDLGPEDENKKQKEKEKQEAEKIIIKK